jgi:hypothetical protein
VTRNERILVAAYLTDRADQYETDSPCWVALTDAASNVVNGEVEASDANGDLDPDLRARVALWIGRPPFDVTPKLGVDEALAPLRLEETEER